MSPFVNNTLDPDIWDNSTIRPHIRASLLRIAAEFLIGLNIEVSPKDITLTGSMANFNYNPQSDLDLHVVIGFSDVDNDVELVKQFLMAKKSLWNLKHQITVKGHDVEVYPQDNSEPHHSTGVYSLLNNEWLVKPTRDDPNIDPATVEKKFNSLAAMIDGILGMPDRINHIANVREKLGAMRKLGLSKAGEFSVENLAFKKLRREGYLDRLASAQLQDRDASLSIAEEGYKMKITKRQLRRIIKEENWTPWLEKRGLSVDDLDHAARYAGGSDRTMLPKSPPTDGMIGPANLEIWAKDKKAKALVDKLNVWLPDNDNVTLKHVKDQTYLIKGVGPSWVSEVKDEIDEFTGASFEYELSSAGKSDIAIRIT